jgi:hypothetical protein
VSHLKVIAVTVGETFHRHTLSEGEKDVYVECRSSHNLITSDLKGTTTPSMAVVDVKFRVTESACRIDFGDGYRETAEDLLLPNCDFGRNLNKLISGPISQKYMGLSPLWNLISI